LLTLADAGARIGRSVLPAVGTRVPAAHRVRFSELSHDAGGSEVSLSSELAQAALAREVVSALELAELCHETDDALARGAVDEARAGYLGLLERAPLHPELTRLVAEIDAAVPARAEAALGLLAESGVVTEGGSAAAGLMILIGDTEGARTALRHDIDAEAYGPIAALRLVQLSELSEGIRERLAVLDEAVARAPLLEAPRWKRLSLRLDVGNVEAALSDAAHLEAAASGARARHEVCLRAARGFLDVGFVRDAGKLFERALRYVPDDAGATAGLARSLIEVGRAERAYALLARAVELSERTGRADADALLDMANLLAERLGDLPGAVARAREVPSSAPRALEARYLEAEWRRRLGDVDGASVAFSRLRDAIELTDAPSLSSVRQLAAAARFERNARDDLVMAERHLAVALKKAPNEAALLSDYREVAAALSARRREAQRDDTPTTPPVGM
jgi:tetratricopeptide (TPR) repeat protein